MARWIAWVCIGLAGACVVAALVVDGDALPYLIGAAVAALGAIRAAYIWS